MKINGTLTAKSGSWNGVKKHVDRNWQHDRNEKSVDKNYSKFNLHDNRETIHRTDHSLEDQLIQRHYLPWLIKYNQRQIKTRNKKRCKSLAQLKAHQTLGALGIATFGKVKTMHQLGEHNASKQSMIEQIRRAYHCSTKRATEAYCITASKGLANYARGFNQRNQFVPIYHWWVNVDEAGAPHVHFAMMPLGQTKLDSHGRPTHKHRARYKSGKHKGHLHWSAGSKPSNSLTNAIEEQENTNNRKIAFTKWNKIETSKLVDTVGKEFQKSFPKVKQFKKGFTLNHTGRKGSISMKSYKATQDASNKQLKKETRELEKQTRTDKEILHEIPTVDSKVNSQIDYAQSTASSATSKAQSVESKVEYLNNSFASTQNSLQFSIASTNTSIASASASVFSEECKLSTNKYHFDYSNELFMFHMYMAIWTSTSRGLYLSYFLNSKSNRRLNKKANRIRQNLYDKACGDYNEHGQMKAVVHTVGAYINQAVTEPQIHKRERVIQHQAGKQYGDNGLEL